MFNLPLIIIIIVFAIIFFRRQKNSTNHIVDESRTVKKLDKVTQVFNVILSIAYIPFSFFSWLLYMALEATIGATNQVFITMIDIFCCITLSIPVLCVLGIVLSIRFRKEGYIFGLL